MAPTAHRVIVGIDGSPAAAAALAWAAREARLRGAELVAWTIVDHRGLPATEFFSKEATGGYPVTIRRGRGDAATALAAAARGADLLVVGSRSRGSVAGLLLGSVSRTCLAHAPCPVVVVHPDRPGTTVHGRVVVGVDMSEHSHQALRVAAQEARFRGAALEVVHAVHWDHLGTEMLTPTVEQLIDWGHRLIAAEFVATGVEGIPVVVHGHAAEVLVRHSADADLLVLGTRGRGQVADLLLGSTSAHCARHAHCPVMIVGCTGDAPQRAPAHAHGMGT
ncbi:universal stress protein [Actinokineospora xionganensis]|uniref:Universal stress protein n=1 Tax=Actinokineospora xionganensis TaxID=2684470 RepID=A0ABR7L0E5_9PSEU|nr:universal stress protein [Actinokineospora xionganensis]MBC6445894.1 universal stress protein [Actinokineospora xionganensis]